MRVYTSVILCKYNKINNVVIFRSCSDVAEHPQGPFWRNTHAIEVYVSDLYILNVE
jgi:hypothetical protein